MATLWQQAAQYIYSHPWLTILLLIAGCVLLFHDLLTPLTWGATGTFGVLFLGTVLAAMLTVHFTGWFGVLVLLAGLALLLVEVHLLPGRGMAGLIGLMLLFAGLFVALDGPRQTAFALSVSAVVTTLTMVAFLTYLPKSPVWKQLGHELEVRSTVQLVGQTGRTLTPLRPVGTAIIGGRRVRVVTEGEFLEAGTVIVVQETDGERVVVDPLEASVKIA